MLEKGKINAGEFLVIVATFTIGSAILIAPAPAAAIAKQDAWIASVLTLLITLFLIFIFNQLTTLYPSMTYVEYNEKIYGKWIGKILTLPYLFYIFFIACGQVRDIGDFFTTEILVETPIQMIMIIFMITSLIGVRLGLEVIVAIIWMLTLYFKMTICYYGLSLGLAQFFGLKSLKILTFPLAFLIIPFAIFVSPNIVNIHQFNTKVLTPYSLTICFILPLLLLVIGKAKKSSASKAAKQPVN
jgi:hypothetical protein